MSKYLDGVREALAEAEKAPAEMYETYYLQKAIALALAGILECMEKAGDVEIGPAEPNWEQEFAFTHHGQSPQQFYTGVER